MEILLIYHHPTVLAAFEEFAHKFNHELSYQSDVLNVRSTLKNYNGNLIVIEMGPSLSSWQKDIEEQRQRVPRPSFVFLGNGSADEIAQASDLGGDAYISKTLHCKLLAMNLASLLRKAQLENDLNVAREESDRVQHELKASLEGQKEAIAEKELTYRELLLAYSRLQNLNQQKNNFLATATHELRTPVTVMKGYHRILLDERLGKLLPEQKEVLRESEQSCARLIKIINSLLDLSRIEAGKLELVYQSYDVTTNFKMIVKQQKDASKRKRLSLILRLEKDLPQVKCDRDKVNQVLTNLLENSIKYTPSGGKIYISAQPYFWEKRDSSAANPQIQEERRRRTGENSNRHCNAVMVQVSDTGIGIPPENQQEIFEEFAQVSSNQMDRTGLGLGLAICKRIIDAHGGRIWVDSQVNSGSRFSFLLPLSPS